MCLIRLKTKMMMISLIKSIRLLLYVAGVYILFKVYYFEYGNNNKIFFQVFCKSVNNIFYVYLILYIKYLVKKIISKKDKEYLIIKEFELIIFTLVGYFVFLTMTELYFGFTCSDIECYKIRSDAPYAFGNYALIGGLILLIIQRRRNERKNKRLYSG